MVIMAIDPGKNGGIAWWDGKKTDYAKMPETEGDICLLIEGVKPDAVYLEKVGGYVRGRSQPGSSMFNFGRGYGYILGVCAALDISVILITPQLWQKSAGCGTRGKLTDTQWKNKLKAEAQRRYPALKVTLWLADALLLLDTAKGKHGAQKAN